MSDGQGEGSKGDNGWTNYETWAVHLWLTNEEGSYRYWRDEAGRHQKESGEDASQTLAEQLKSESEEASPLEGASLFSVNRSRKTSRRTKKATKATTTAKRIRLRTARRQRENESKT